MPEIRDLVKSELVDVWMDEEFVYTNVYFLTFSLPREEFLEFATQVNLAAKALLEYAKEVEG